MTWPKERATLSEEQSVVMTDWINQFLTEAKPSHFAWLTGFERIVEKRYHLPYEWMIRQDHCNTAREVLGELEHRFRVRRRSFFPLRVPTVDLNLMVGLELTI